MNQPTSNRSPLLPAVLSGLFILLLLLTAARFLLQEVQLAANAQQQDLQRRAAAARLAPAAQLLSEELQQPLTSVTLRLQDLALYTRVFERHTGTAGYYSNLREVVQLMLRETLLAAPLVSDVYGIWLPDAVDEQDAVFAEDVAYGSNEAGRFASHWRQDGGQASADVLPETVLQQPPPVLRWFPCVIDSGRVCWLRENNRLLVGIPMLGETGEVIGAYGAAIELAALTAPLRQEDLPWTALFHRADPVAAQAPEAALAELAPVLGAVGQESEPGWAALEQSLWYLAPLSLAEQTWWVAVGQPAPGGVALLGVALERFWWSLVLVGLAAWGLAVAVTALALRARRS